MCHEGKVTLTYSMHLRMDKELYSAGEKVQNIHHVGAHWKEVYAARKKVHNKQLAGLGRQESMLPGKGT
jgi:hypothetical protein